MADNQDSEETVRNPDRLHSRLALAVHRRGGANRIANLGASLQTPPACATPTLNASDRQTARVENVDPVKVARGRERCQALWDSISGGGEEMDTDMDENDEPRILVDWVPMPMAVGDIPDGRLYQAAIAWQLEQDQRVFSRIKTTWGEFMDISDVTVHHRVVDGNKIWTIFLWQHGSTFETDPAFGDWLALHLMNNLDISLTQPFQGIWVRMDRLRHPMGLDPDHHKHLVLVRTHARPEQLSSPPAFALQQPSATDLFPLEGLEDALIGDALLEERGSDTPLTDAPSTALSMWISMQQALNNWQNARSLNEPVGALPDVDLMLALDSERMPEAGWCWPQQITFAHLIQMVAAVARRPWVAFVKKCLHTIFSHWDPTRSCGDVEMVRLKEAASLLRIEDACTLLVLAGDKSLSTINNIPAHYWWICRATDGNVVMFDRQGFRSIKDFSTPERWLAGRWSKQWDFEKIYCLYVFADRNGGSVFSVGEYADAGLVTVIETNKFFFPDIDITTLLANIRRWTGKFSVSQTAILDYEATKAFFDNLPSGSGPSTHASCSSAAQSTGLRPLTEIQRRVALIKAMNPNSTWEPLEQGQKSKKDKGKQKDTGGNNDDVVEARLSQLSIEREPLGGIERASRDDSVPPLLMLSVGKEFTPPPNSSPGAIQVYAG